MKSPAIGTVVDVPTLHPDSDYAPVIKRKWCGKQRGTVIELMEPDKHYYPDDLLVCLEIAGEDGTKSAWFRTSHIRAGTISDPEFSLSVDAWVCECRPETPDDPSRLHDGYAYVFFPEDGWWHAWKRYEGPVAD